MGKFLENERLKQTKTKVTSCLFTNPAKVDGYYRGKPRPFCLPVELADQNLFTEIRDNAINYFNELNIAWHDGKNGNPSNHLCDSQVCCVNFLFPFANNPNSLKKILLPFFPDIDIMLPIEEGMYVAFEWIGQQNYLAEKIPKNGHRTRGANCTSADSIVMYQRADKKKHAILIEWKYSESYSSTSLKYSKSGTDRTKIYQRLFEQSDCPINKKILPHFDSLFYEPFYQFMRQQFLAHEMEKASELGADTVSLLHIAPKHNPDFQKVTSPDLTEIGSSVISVWNKLITNNEKFKSVSSEELFGTITIEQFPEMANWLDYMATRYAWVYSEY